MNIYAIRDRIANDLLAMQMYRLFCFKTDQQAARYFSDGILDEKSVLNKHPNDYELIKCGHVADDGRIEGWQIPEIIITGSALLATQPALVKEA